MSISSQGPKPLVAALPTNTPMPSPSIDHQAGKSSTDIVLRTAAAPSNVNVHPRSPGLEDGHVMMNKSFIKQSSAGVKYTECLKNHAAAIGGNATDGCGEFMAGGEEGTLEALKCSACNCHRNFHRKIHVHTEPASSNSRRYPSASAPACAKKSNTIYSGGAKLGLAAGNQLTYKPKSMEGEGQLLGEVKKRFRTKFTQEQKEKMLGFAEKAGWKLQKLDDSEVRRFCQEIGIKRKVLKVWMHNNKYNLSKKTNTSTN
ncbi:hypothetical protein CDL12_07283 [Handroanthus impetiginosus]|uniref:ZF-HD dimerization-type domain-containing protein n=1 Tax=Handroanthus impetiginosus TaxID=429701 RepID=A0A2G9HR66_9LAMI|nr:hypothetical protein CDL12_07283 [Handroanthus impetiginosus]